jgi:hypothetical protein
MQNVKLIGHVYDDKFDRVGHQVEEEFGGVIRFDVSPMGVIGIQLYTGKQLVFNLSDFYKCETVPLTDEEILNGEDKEFAAWYKNQVEVAEEAARKKAAEVPLKDPTGSSLGT